MRSTSAVITHFTSLILSACPVFATLPNETLQALQDNLLPSSSAVSNGKQYLPALTGSVSGNATLMEPPGGSRRYNV